MDEKDIWIEYNIEKRTEFEIDNTWRKFNSDDTVERLRVVRYPDTDSDKIHMFYNKIKPQALVEWNDGTSEMTYEEVEHLEDVKLMSEVYAFYFGDNGSEFKVINSIEDLYEI